MDLQKNMAALSYAQAAGPVFGERGLAPDCAEVVDAILRVVRTRTSIDFSLYRRRTIERRVQNRMLALGMQSPAGYLAHLQSDPREALALIERLTIKVSRFYRNPGSWRLLADAAYDLFTNVGRELRVWSAGCASGEEPYSLAIMLREQGIPHRVLATDIDPSALEAAKQGRYPASACADLPHALADRYLTGVPGHPFVRMSSDVAQRINWVLNDLAQPPREHSDCFDLICCRNVLIYMQRDLQRQVLQRLLVSLEVGGLLWLGEAEWPLVELMPHFEIVSKKDRLFRKVALATQVPL